MRIPSCFALLGAAALLASVVGSAYAQQTPPMPPGHRPPSTMGGMMGMHGPMRHPMMGSGRIVGNKNTKVYHLPGDKGNMPAEKNRVYFRSEQEAIRAGYHAAGKKPMGKPGMMGMHGPMRHPMMGGKMNGSTSHLPK